jgi:hypothetical protein
LEVHLRDIVGHYCRVWQQGSDLIPLRKEKEREPRDGWIRSKFATQGFAA